MANQLYGSNSYGYAAASNPASIFTSRSVVDQYVPTDPAYLSSSRYYGADPLYSYASIGAGGYSAAGGSTAWSGPPGVEGDANAAYAGLKRPSAEALYHQSLLGTHNTIGQSEDWYSTDPLTKRPRFASSLPVYPQRPGEKDCAHYMLTRTCKYGDTCKFDHPLWVPEGGIPDWKEVPISVASESLPERPEAPDCPYYLKTQTCKFGPRCKFNHPKDKVASLSENALPDRPSEPPCVFYMKTGKCKFGATCKFHHPKDVSIPTAEVEKGNGAQIVATSGGVNGNSTPSFTPAMLHNSKGLPIRPGEPDCPFYLKTFSCKYGPTCRYNHPERYAMDPSSVIVSTPVVPLNIGYANPTHPVLQTTVDPRIAHPTLALGPTIHPQRPGQPECDYYMKSGECMFGERCRFHHPLDRSSHAQSAKDGQANGVKLTLAGLPRREGAVHCPYYMKTGACKYGATCKFDHPPPGEVIAASTSQGAATTTGEEVKEG
ncbi:zinc finger CCCH domain-containing protein 37 [Rutidosis leptorrhynchoides]|uniref:zinc finger CCCH domain-containing protein 37 n=1 Tax=Rutidosis leptorrhynchoides TaxID=125765 RepID=UPI003A99D929